MYASIDGLYIKGVKLNMLAYDEGALCVELVNSEFCNVGGVGCIEFGIKVDRLCCFLAGNDGSADLVACHGAVQKLRINRVESAGDFPGGGEFWFVFLRKMVVSCEVNMALPD